MESDLINLDELKSLYGDESARELLEMSLREGQQLLAALRKSVPARNSESVSTDAHQLKGMSATMTMTRMAELGLKLEHSARAESWQECDALLEQIDACFAEIEQILSRAFA